METLVNRRAALCLSFAKKAYKSEKFSEWFTESETDLQLAEVTVRTARYWKYSLFN